MPVDRAAGVMTISAGAVGSRTLRTGRHAEGAIGSPELGVFLVDRRGGRPRGERKNQHCRASRGPKVRMPSHPMFSRCQQLAKMPASIGANKMDLSVGRNDREQKIGFHLAAGMDGVRAGIVVGMIVRVVHAADAVTRLDVEGDAVALSEHHRGWPN